MKGHYFQENQRRVVYGNPQYPPGGYFKEYSMDYPTRMPVFRGLRFRQYGEEQGNESTTLERTKSDRVELCELKRFFKSSFVNTTNGVRLHEEKPDNDPFVVDAGAIDCELKEMKMSTTIMNNIKGRYLSSQVLNGNDSPSSLLELENLTIKIARKYTWLTRSNKFLKPICLDNFREFLAVARPAVKGKGRKRKRSRVKGVHTLKCRRNTKVINHPEGLDLLDVYIKLHSYPNIARLKNSMLYLERHISKINFVLWRCGFTDVIDTFQNLLVSLYYTGRTGTTSLKECLKEHLEGRVKQRKKKGSNKYVNREEKKVQLNGESNIIFKHITNNSIIKTEKLKQNNSIIKQNSDAGSYSVNNFNKISKITDKPSAQREAFLFVPRPGTLKLGPRARAKTVWCSEKKEEYIIKELLKQELMIGFKKENIDRSLVMNGSNLCEETIGEDFGGNALNVDYQYSDQGLGPLSQELQNLAVEDGGDEKLRFTCEKDQMDENELTDRLVLDPFLDINFNVEGDGGYYLDSFHYSFS